MPVERCRHEDDWCYAVYLYGEEKQTPKLCCQDCVCDFVFLLSARGIITIDRRQNPKRAPNHRKQELAEFTGFTTEKDLPTGDFRARLESVAPKTEQEMAEAAYPNHHPTTALINWRAGREIWDSNGDLW